MRKFNLLLTFIAIGLIFNNSIDKTFAQQQNIASPFKQQQIQKPNISGKVEENTKTTQNEPNKKLINPVLNPNNVLGVANAEQKLQKANLLIQSKNSTEARYILEPLTNWLVDATDYHNQLAKRFKEIKTAKSQADAERELAYKFALLRDDALYKLALVYVEEKKLQNAVEKLVDVVTSQPNTPLGFSSYELLQKIGFTYKIQLDDTENTANTETSTTTEK